MQGVVVGIHEPKPCRSGDGVYRRIEIMVWQPSPGKYVWTKTDIVESFRNARNWREVLAAGIGTAISGLTLRRGVEINADSHPVITGTISITNGKPDEPPDVDSKQGEKQGR